MLVELRLLAARGPAARAAVARSIEANAADRARLIQSASSYSILGGGTEERDAHCRARVAGS